MGTVEVDPRGVLHGVAHKMTKADFQRLRQSEGGGGVSPKGYVPVLIKATLYDGRTIDAFLLQGQGSVVEPGRFFLPSTRYLTLLREGAVAYRVDENYVNWLNAHPAHSKNILSFFMLLIGLICMLVLLPFILPYAIAARCCGMERGAWSYDFMPAFFGCFWCCFGCLPGSGLVDTMPKSFHESDFYKTADGRDVSAATAI